MVREGRTGTVQLKARDSPEGGDRGDGRTHLIFILCVSVVWTVSGEEGGVGGGGVGWGWGAGRKDDKHRRARAECGSGSCDSQ